MIVVLFDKNIENNVILYDNKAVSIRYTVTFFGQITLLFEMTKLSILLGLQEKSYFTLSISYRLLMKCT